MAFPLQIVQSNIVGMDPVPGDELDYLRYGRGGDDTGAGVPDNYLPTVFEAIPYSIDLTFNGLYENIAQPGEYKELPAINVTTDFDWNSVGLVYEKIDVNVIRISGSVQRMFPDQYYKFVVPDTTLQILPATTHTPYLSLVEYNMPNPNTVQKTYSKVSATIPPDPIMGGSATTIDVDILQWVHWSFPSARANILYLRPRGLR
jgi:hypothetical protein